MSAVMVVTLYLSTVESFRHRQNRHCTSGACFAQAKISTDSVAPEELCCVPEHARLSYECEPLHSPLRCDSHRSYVRAAHLDLGCSYHYPTDRFGHLLVSGVRDAKPETQA